MLNTKLVKALGEAGFPFKKPNKIPIECSEEPFRQTVIINDEVYLIPILEELIRECGGVIIKLWILADGRAGIQLEGESLDDVVYYSTPSEAVANLYLSCNQKNIA